MLTGVSNGTKKNGDLYFRSSITYKGKHISLGSYITELDAHKAYKEAQDILDLASTISLYHYNNKNLLSYDKWVILMNFRDHNIYFKTPIYLVKQYFEYHLSPSHILKFDVDDLFYYAHHKIMKRGGHYFVADYGMQINVLSRYGIKNYAVLNIDYIHKNGDPYDYRYSNIHIINRYHGVFWSKHKGVYLYIAKIHINGNFIIGRYQTEIEAAIAYNKAANLLQRKGTTKNYQQNYLDEMDEIQYASLYQKIRISNKLLTYIQELDNKTIR